MTGAAPLISKPWLQIALDQRELRAAHRVLDQAASEIDVIEVGTVLCLSAGMAAVRTIKTKHPNKPVLADIRIAEAGAILSRLAFDSGANWVSVVAGASAITIGQTCLVAAGYKGEVQIELGETLNPDDPKIWRDLGVTQVIVHRSRDAEASGSLHWSDEDLERITELHNLGFRVTITGGIKPDELAAFTGIPVGIVIAGRSITEAVDPLQAASDFQKTLQKVWPT